MSTSSVVSVDPRTGETVETVAATTQSDEVAAICRAAAQASTQLTALEPRQRADLLSAMADALGAEREHLVEIADRESALGPVRLNGELSRTTGQLRLFAEVLREGAFCEAIIDHANPEAVPPSPDLRRMLVGLGAVGVFGSSNFPFAFSVAGGDTAAALAAGCAVVAKVHSAHPRLSADVAEILRRTCVAHGLPEATVSVVYGREAGPTLVQNPHIKAVGFTGSESGGRALFDLAMARPEPIPFYAEMSSLNPLVVSPHAAARRPEAVAEGIIGSVTLGHGQFCTKPGVVLLPDDEAGNAVLDRMAAHMRTVAPQHMLSTGIRDSYEHSLAGVLGVEGVVKSADGLPVEGAGSMSSAALAQTDAATVVANPSVLTECFGPATLVVRYADQEQLDQALGLVPPSLTVSVHAEDDETTLVGNLSRMASQRTGRLVYNGFPTGVAVSWAQHHGGPYPATSYSLFTSVGATSIRRFQRPLTFQDWPDALLPKELQESNPLGLPRRVDGVLRSESS